jgi:hypothetical protein
MKEYFQTVTRFSKQWNKQDGCLQISERKTDAENAVHTVNTTPLTFEFYTSSSILILLIMRRWQDGSLSVSFHRPETAVPSYSFFHSSQALHSVVEFVFKCSFHLHSFRSLQPFDNFFFSLPSDTFQPHQSNVSLVFLFSFHSGKQYLFWHSFFIPPFSTSVPS